MATLSYISVFMVKYMNIKQKGSCQSMKRITEATIQTFKMYLLNEEKASATIAVT